MKDKIKEELKIEVRKVAECIIFQYGGLSEYRNSKAINEIEIELNKAIEIGRKLGSKETAERAKEKVENIIPFDKDLFMVVVTKDVVYKEEVLQAIHESIITEK